MHLARSPGRRRPDLRFAALVALIVAAFVTVPLAAPARAAGSVVKVTGSQGNWQLQVNGSPYVVKGVTWGPAVSDAEKYMPDLASMGVNTIRTWGTDGTSKPLLDSAAAHGVKVIAGFWLQPGGGPGSGGCVDYVTDSTYKTNMLNEIGNWVTTYRDNPGVLMWNVGNESVLGMQNCFSGTALENERNAYTSFVNDVAVKIHGIDPNHPVTSTDAWTGAWPYYKANTPALDLYAVNSYNGVCAVKQTWIDGGYSKPYIITETGPAGEWEVANDGNGVPAEPTDQAKAAGYTNAWNCITGHHGVALGATMFHYGIEQDFGGVWFNLIPAGLKRLSYYAVQQAYGGPAPANTPPVISNMAVANAASVAAGQPFDVTASVRDPQNDPVSYTIKVSGKYATGDGTLTNAAFTQTGNGSFRVTAPQQLGVWKVYIFAQDGKGNVGIETKSFRVVPPQVGGVNLARGRPATASSYQTYQNLVPGNATDGDLATRWASDWSDPQWIQVDLGSVHSFDHVQLVWESAYAKAYTIQTSDNGTDWRTAYSTTTGDGGVDDLGVSGSGRYVRVNGTQRGTGYGYSLYDLGVYGS
ncbi:MAG TPA: discoidin domain-containing protein [Actinoallomurus sp.]